MTERCTKQKYLSETDGAVAGQIKRSAAEGVYQYPYRCSVCGFIHLATKYDGKKLPRYEGKKRGGYEE